MKKKEKINHPHRGVRRKKKSSRKDVGRNSLKLKTNDRIADRFSFIDCNSFISRSIFTIFMKLVP